MTHSLMSVCPALGVVRVRAGPSGWVPFALTLPDTLDTLATSASRCTISHFQGSSRGEVAKRNPASQLVSLSRLPSHPALQHERIGELGDASCEAKLHPCAEHSSVAALFQSIAATLEG